VVLFYSLFLFGVFVMGFAMYSGSLPERANDRLACAGRLGIRFLFGVSGWSWFALRVHKLGMPTKIGISGMAWDRGGMDGRRGGLKKHSSWRVLLFVYSENLFLFTVCSCRLPFIFFWISL